MLTNEDQKETDVLALPLDAETLSQLDAYALLTGKPTLEDAAVHLLQELLADREFWTAFLDPTGVIDAKVH